MGEREREGGGHMVGHFLLGIDGEIVVFIAHLAFASWPKKKVDGEVVESCERKGIYLSL